MTTLQSLSQKMDRLRLLIPFPDPFIPPARKAFRHLCLREKRPLMKMCCLYLPPTYCSIVGINQNRETHIQMQRWGITRGLMYKHFVCAKYKCAYAVVIVRFSPHFPKGLSSCQNSWVPTAISPPFSGVQITLSRIPFLEPVLVEEVQSLLKKRSHFRGCLPEHRNMGLLHDWGTKWVVIGPFPTSWVPTNT